MTGSQQLVSFVVYYPHLVGSCGSNCRDQAAMTQNGPHASLVSVGYEAIKPTRQNSTKSRILIVEGVTAQ